MKAGRTLMILCMCSMFSANHLAAQETEEEKKKLEVNGYFTSMQSVMDLDTPDSRWITDYQITNRLNLYYYPVKSLIFSVQSRNSFIYGDQIKFDMAGIRKKSIAADNGLMDLTFNVFEGNSYVFNVNIDRLWLKYTVSKFDITLGRQRINWGQTFVWNPNDIFNAYSYFDFGYEERPGSDALRIQYYTGATSGLEVAVKADSANNVTAAALFRMNRWGYDMQVLGGILNSEDLAAGLGWSGSIGGVGFKGEMSYFHPYRKVADTSGLVFISLGLDYTFANSIYMGVEGLYNQLPENFYGSSFIRFYTGPLTVKNLSFTAYNLFAQVSYPITPILNASLAGMFFPDIRGFFVGPSCTYSLMDDFELSLYLQFFDGAFPGTTGTKKHQSFGLGFLRFKYSF